MVESLKKLREPAASVLVAVLGARLLLGLITVLAAGGGSTASFYVLEPTLVVVLTLVVASCVLVDPTPRARLLVLLALIGIVAAGALSFVFGLVALAQFGGGFGVAGLFDKTLSLVIPLVAGLGLLTLLKGLPAPARSQPALGQGGGYPPPQGYGPPSQQYGPPPQQNQPTWQPDQSAGQSWHTAGDAASGAAASGWGKPGQQQGWQPSSASSAASAASAAETPQSESATETPQPESANETRLSKPGKEKRDEKPSTGPQWWDQS